MFTEAHHPLPVTASASASSPFALNGLTVDTSKLPQGLNPSKALVGTTKLDGEVTVGNADTTFSRFERRTCQAAEPEPDDIGPWQRTLRTKPRGAHAWGRPRHARPPPPRRPRLLVAVVAVAATAAALAALVTAAFAALVVAAPSSSSSPPPHRHMQRKTLMPLTNSEGVGT